MVAGAVGSLHCAAMCGPLQALYLDPDDGAAARMRGALAHAGGRVAAYATLGALAGGVGAAIDLAGRAAAVQRVAMIVAGVAVVVWGALALAAALGVGVPRLRPRVWSRGLVQLRRRRPGARAVLLGLLSAALPCGWLWAFVMLAAGTGSPVGGAAVMIAFWLGTVPMMVGVGAATAALVKRIGPRLPLVTALTLIAVGVLSLVARVPMLHAGTASHAAETSSAVPSTPACHGETP